MDRNTAFLGNTRDAPVCVMGRSLLEESLETVVARAIAEVVAVGASVKIDRGAKDPDEMVNLWRGKSLLQLLVTEGLGTCRGARGASRTSLVEEAEGTRRPPFGS